MKIGSMLSAYMNEREMSLRDVAKEVGVNHATIQRLIHGKQISTEVLHKFYIWLLSSDK